MNSVIYPKDMPRVFLEPVKEIRKSLLKYYKKSQKSPLSDIDIIDVVLTYDQYKSMTNRSGPFTLDLVWAGILFTVLCYPTLYYALKVANNSTIMFLVLPEAFLIMGGYAFFKFKRKFWKDNYLHSKMLKIVNTLPE